MADGSIVIDTTINNQGVDSELKALQREMRNLHNEMNLANQKAMMPFQKQIVKTEMDMFKLSKSMGTYTGSNKEFMASVQQLGAEQKKTADQMINANRMIGQSAIQTAGQMLNMSTQASKISDNYDRMGNALLLVNKGGLAVADSLNKMALAGDASVLALKTLGPNASMKQLQDQINLINTGLMRVPMVAMAAAASSVLLYSTLHKAAMESNKEYEKSFTTMTANIKKAFEPMVQAFSIMVGAIWDGINAVAELIIKFNEAHPLIALIVQGMMMLVPALTLILAPLAIGIGLWKGLLATWGLTWGLIGPLVTGLAAMSATVWIVAAAIAGLVLGINHLWTTNEGFRNAVITAWEAIKAKAIEVFGMLTPLLQEVADKFNTLKDAVIAAATGDFSQLYEIFQQLIPNIIAFLVGGFPGLLITAANMVYQLATGAESKSGDVVKVINNLVDKIVQFLETSLPKFLDKGIKILDNLIQGLLKVLPKVIQTFVDLIAKVLPILLNALPKFLDAGIKILTALIDGIIKILPKLLETALKLVTSILDTIIKNLPKIIDAGVKILNSLIDGIIKILPKLIETAVKLITSILETITKNLPKILEAGVKLLTSLIDGIVKMLPKLITTAAELVIKLAGEIIRNLPQIIKAGAEILDSLVKGIRSVISSLMKTISSITKDILKAFKDVDLVDIGKNIIKGLASGITGAAGAVWDAVKGITDEISRRIKKAMDINSPSRVTAEYGEFISLGLAKGITDKTRAVIQASQGMANAVTTGMTSGSTNNTYYNSPVKVNLNYSGGSPSADMYGMVDYMETALNDRLNSRMRMGGYKK